MRSPFTASQVSSAATIDPGGNPSVLVIRSRHVFYSLDLKFRQDDRLGSDFIVRVSGLGLAGFFPLSPLGVVCVFPFGCDPTVRFLEAADLGAGTRRSP